MKPLPVLVLLAALVAGGCAGAHDGPANSVPPPAVGPVDKIDLLPSPTALSWDRRPGPDGVGVRVYFYQLAQPQPVTVQGTVELLLFEGPAGADEPAGARPSHVWRLKSEDLRPYLTRSIVGWGYVLRLPWGRRVPTSRSISLVVRYTSPDGKVLHSAPAAISMTAN